MVEPKEASEPTALQAEIWLKISAGFAGIWLRTHDQEQAITEIRQLAADGQRITTVAKWDIVRGMDVVVGVAAADTQQHGGKMQSMGEGRPKVAISAFRSYLPETPESEDADAGGGVLIIQNTHRFVGQTVDIQAIQNAVSEFESLGGTLIMLADPSADIPVDLERHVVVVDHDLPSDDELWEFAESAVCSYLNSYDESDDHEAYSDIKQKCQLPPRGSREAMAIIEPARGFTRQEFVGAACQSLIEHGKILPAELWVLKDQMLKRKNLLELYRGNDGFESLGGLKIIKRDTLEIFHSPHIGEPGVQPRGLILLGPGGTGKSQFAKCLGKETGRPVLIFEIGKLFGSLVGQTESRTREVLALADAMAPCILFVDEIDRALAGTSGGSGDSGVASRMMGSLMTWLNDHKSDVYFVGTSNNVSGLPDEFLRAQRFDGIYFFDFPQAEAQRNIWDLYLKQFNLDPDSELPEHNQWTGAEIMSCCRLARLRNKPLTEVAKSICPQATVNRDGLAALRKWAEGKCQSADYEGPYRGPEDPAKVKAKSKATEPGAGKAKRRRIRASS